jgi:hypothetical protein
MAGAAGKPRRPREQQRDPAIHNFFVLSGYAKIKTEPDVHKETDVPDFFVLLYNGRKDDWSWRMCER